jgi:hypothetical protein
LDIRQTLSNKEDTEHNEDEATVDKDHSHDEWDPKLSSHLNWLDKGPTGEEPNPTRTHKLENKERDGPKEKDPETQAPKEDQPKNVIRIVFVAGKYLRKIVSVSKSRYVSHGGSRPDLFHSMK